MSRLSKALERLRLSSKLGIGFAAILLIALIQGGYGLYGRSVLEREIERLYAFELLGISDIKEARIDLAKMGRAIRQAVLAPDGPERARALDGLAEAETGLRRALDAARPRIFRDENKRDLARFEDMFKVYKAAVDKTLALLRGDAGDATAYVVTPEFQRAGIAADEALAMVAKAKEEGARQSAHAATTQAAEATRAAEMLMVGGVAIAVLFALMIAGSIRRPTDEVTSAVEAIAAGGRDIPVPHTDSPNEMGALARAIDVLRREARQMEAQRWIKSHLAAISGELREASSAVDLARIFLASMAPLLKVGHGAFYRLDEDGRLRLLGTYAFRTRKSLEQSFAIGEGLVGQCALERAPIVITQPPPDYICASSGVGDITPQAISVLPVMRGDALLAVVELATLDDFGPNEQALLDGAMPILAMSLEIIERAARTRQLLKETQIQAASLAASERQLAARKEELERINEQLAEQGRLVEEQAVELGHERSLLRSLIDSIPDIIFVKDVLGTYIVANEAFSKLLGRPTDDILGKTDFDLFPAELADQFRDRDLAVLADGEVGRNEESVTYPNGRVAHLETAKVPLTGPAGELQGLIGIARDVTARKAADRALAEAEERARLLLGAIGEGICGLSGDGLITFVNPAGARMLGYEPDELIGEPMRRLVSREDHTAGDGRSRTVADEVLWRKDGSSVPVEYATTPVIKEGQVVGTVVSFTDITERKRADEELRHVNFLNDQALGLTKAGYWHVPLDGSGWYNSSKRAVDIFGDIPNEGYRYRVIEDWLVNVEAGDPEYAKATGKNFQDAIDGTVPAYDSIYAYKRPIDGAIVWIHAYGTVARDQDGKPTDMYGVTQDITEYVLAQSELAKAKADVDALAAAPALPDIDPDVFDFERMGPIYKWDMARLGPVLAGFLDDSAAKVAAIARAVEDGDTRLRDLAHGLKGAANTAGAVRLGRLAADIEDAALGERADAVAMLAPLLAPTLDELKSALSIFVPAPRGVA